MLVLALLIIILAVVVGAFAVKDGGEPATVEILGQNMDTRISGVFLTGAVTMLMLLLGMWLLTTALGRARHRRKERKATTKQQRDSVRTLEQERADLRTENERLAEQLQDQHPAVPGGTTAGGGTDDTLGARPVYPPPSGSAGNADDRVIAARPDAATTPPPGSHGWDQTRH